MTWVLIMGLYLTGSTGGVGSVVVEFQNKEACEAAGKAMTQEWGRGGVTLRDQSRYVCVKRQ